MPEVTSRFADLDAATLYYLTAGGGDSVVLLHGIPQTSHGWRYVIPRLAERYRVIAPDLAPDLRGLGGSSHPPLATREEGSIRIFGHQSASSARQKLYFQLWSHCSGATDVSWLSTSPSSASRSAKPWSAQRASA